MSKISKEELEAFWRGNKNTYQKLYALRMQQKADEAEKQGKLVTYVPNDGSATLPEVSVTAPRETEELKNLRLKLDYENLGELGLTVAGFVPGLDTAVDIADIANSWRKGDYSGMLWGLAGIGLPVSGKALKSGWNWFKNLPSIRNYKASREISSAINDNIKNGMQAGQYYHGSPSRNITNFKLGKDGGIYWTRNKDAAKLYTGLFGTGKVYNADLNLGNKVVTINNNGLPWTKIPENEVAKAFNLSKDQVHNIIGNYNLGAVPWHYEFTKMFGYKPKTNYYAIDLVVKLGKNQGISGLVVNNVTDSGKRLFSKTMPYDQTIVYNPGQVILNKNQDFLKSTKPKIISYVSPTKRTTKTADFSKALSNIQLLDRMDEFANKYGYPLSDRSTILSNRKTNKQVRDLIARHNTYLRGVSPYGFESDDVQNVKALLGDNMTGEDFMRYSATHKRTPDSGIWISPEENAFIYGGKGKTALVRRKYNLGKNRNKWFEEGDFKVQTNPVLEGKSWNNITGIIAPWYTPSGKGLIESELLSMDNLNFAGWGDPNNWRNKVSLNSKVRKQGGKL